MRTTVTLDDDVAELLRRVQPVKGLSMKETVNLALRAGLLGLEKKTQRKRYRLQPVSLGRCLLPNLDDIAEAIARSEGEDHA
jgi:hypothetical protein